MTRHPTAASTRSASSSPSWNWGPGPTGKSGGATSITRWASCPTRACESHYRNTSSRFCPGCRPQGHRRLLRYNPGPAGRRTASYYRRAASSHLRLWASQVLTHRSPGGCVETVLPGPPLPDDSVRHAQGCLERPRKLQKIQLPVPPGGGALRHYWNYHLRRFMPWTGAGNDPNLTEGFRQGLADRRALEPRKAPHVRDGAKPARSWRGFRPAPLAAAKMDRELRLRAV